MIPIDRSRTCEALLDAVDRARAVRDTDSTIAAIRACLDHPCAAHEFDVADLSSELAALYRSTSRYDEAIEAWEHAIAAGYRSVPHPRADIAEILLESGRRTQTDALFAQLRSECGDDVWLYNSAGISYAQHGDDIEALRWLDAGIELALRTGDPEDILGQLTDFREKSLVALGRTPDDDLARRVAAFTRPPGPRRTITGYYGGTEPTPRPCTHCGWQPEAEPTGRPNPHARGPVAPDISSEDHTGAARNQPCPCGSGRKYKRCHASQRAR